MLSISNKAPMKFRRMVVNQLSRDFRAATAIEHVDLPTEIKPTEIIVRNVYVGINASDINFTAGVYRPNMQPPFGVGFEAMGQVVGMGPNVKNFELDDLVISQSFGAFSEVQVVPSRTVRKIPRLDPKLLPLEISGTTASVGLEVAAQPQKGEVALVTAAAGGTGQFAVQLLKKVYGCKVIGTCSTDGKAEFLRQIGCDRAVNYSTEDLSKVLENEFRGVYNVGFESVGGEMFDTAVRHLGTKGRLVVVGNIRGYKDGSSYGKAPAMDQPIGSTLLWKSASLRGFFLPHYAKHVPEHFERLSKLVEEGTITSYVDPSKFLGIERIADAVDYLHSGRNCGKVMVQLQEEN